jgi:hypothetical protein
MLPFSHQEDVDLLVFMACSDYIWRNNNMAEKEVTVATAKHAFEFFKLIQAAGTEEDKIVLIKKWGATLPLNMLLSLNFDSTLALDLPEGMPPHKRDEQTHFDLFAPLASQLVRLKACLKTSKIKKMDKERVFIQVIENVSPAEADILIACKDRALTEMFPSITKELVAKVYPGYCR